MTDGAPSRESSFIHHIVCDITHQTSHILHQYIVHHTSHLKLAFPYATTSGSSPESRSAWAACGSMRGARPRTALAIAAMCAGVEPQQPPTILTQPFAANSLRTVAMSSGDSSYPPNAF